MNLLPSRRLVAGILLSCSASGGAAQALDTPWRLRVMDMQHQVKVDATIRFTKEAARSCMDGDWKRVAVDTAMLQDEDFFPLKTPLAYAPKDKRLTLGRTQVCDGYLFLSGPLQSRRIEGSYDAVGWGRTQLGYFLLEKVE